MLLRSYSLDDKLLAFTQVALYKEVPAPLLPQAHSTNTNNFFTIRNHLSFSPSLPPPIELAVTDNPEAVVGNGEAVAAVVNDSKAVVEELYRALERGDAEAVRRLLNPDVDWWFHGPRAHQHLVLMRLLTGAIAGGGGLPFKVRSVDAFGPTVLAEGTDATGKLYWVHAWTVGPGGRVTEVREYCNTALVVTRLGGEDTAATSTATKAKACSSPSQQVWQSRLPDRARRNLPGLVLAI